jgi:hypothetical protein
LELWAPFGQLAAWNACPYYLTPYSFTVVSLKARVTVAPHHKPHVDLMVREVREVGGHELRPHPEGDEGAHVPRTDAGSPRRVGSKMGIRISEVLIGDEMGRGAASIIKRKPQGKPLG